MPRVTLNIDPGRKRRERESAARQLLTQFVQELDGNIGPEQAKMLQEIERSMATKGRFPLDYETTEQARAEGPVEQGGEAPMADVAVRRPIDLRRRKKTRYLPFNRAKGTFDEPFEDESDMLTKVLEYGGLPRSGPQSKTAAPAGDPEEDGSGDGSSERDPAQVKAAQTTLAQYDQAARAGELTEEMVRRAVSAAEYLGLPVEEIEQPEPDPKWYLPQFLEGQKSKKVMVPSFKKKGDGGVDPALQEKAAQWLKTNGAPVTPANVAAVIKAGKVK